MAQEIERKFRVTGDYQSKIIKSYPIKQGYLSTVPERTVRVRTKGEKGFITIKGKTDESGMSRFEWEKEIPYEEATELLALCEHSIIEKIRHIVKYKEYFYEVDVFTGENEGLTLAELELSKIDATYLKPEWLGEEVTGDERFYNAQLCINPYKFWRH